MYYVYDGNTERSLIGAEPWEPKPMRTVVIRLTDEEINFLYAAVDAYVGDIAACGEDVPAETQEVNRKLLAARTRARGSQSLKAPRNAPRREIC